MQADSFAGAKEEEKRRLAPLGMTVGCFAVRMAMGVYGDGCGWVGVGGIEIKGRLAALLPAAGRRNDRG